jgi:hypothetical protein
LLLRPPELEAVRTEQDLLGHRPLDLPDTDGRMQYVISDDTITIRIDDSPVDWRFALSYPPAASYRRVPTTRLRRSRGRSSRR